MTAHVFVDVAFADPFEGAFEEVLPVGAAGDVGAPFLDVGVLGVAEFGFAEGDEGTGIDGV